MEDLKNRMGIVVYTPGEWYFSDETAKNILMEHFQVSDLSGLGLKDFSAGINAAGGLLRYLYEIQKTNLCNLAGIHPYTTEK